MKKLNFLVLLVVAAAGLISQPSANSTKIKDNQSVAKPGAVAIRERVEILAFLTGTTQFQLIDVPVTGTVPEFTRNGLVQAPGIDYSVSGRIVTLIFPALWATDDIVTCRYNY